MNKRVKNNKIIIMIVLLVTIVSVTIFLSTFHQKETKHEIICIPKTIDEASGFWTALIAGMKLGAEESNVNMQLVAGVSETDYKGQNKLIEEAIRKKPDAIIVAPCDYIKSETTLEKVVENGIELILIDSEIRKDVGQCMIGTDNYKAGKELGMYMKNFCKPDTQIGIIGHVKENSTAIDREKGIRQGLGEYNTCIKTVEFCGSSYEKAYQLTCEMLQKNPHITMMIGLNEYSSVGVARAIEDLGYKDKIMVMGFDNSVEQIQLMEKGVFKATIIQMPFNIGYLGVKKAVDVLEGRRLEKRLNSGSKLITINNMYLKENQKLLYPFV